MSSSPSTEAAAAEPGALARFFAGDVWYSFTRSPVAIVSAVLVLLCVVSAVFAPWLAPHDPFDLASCATCWAPTTRAATSCRR
jgi:peptide/nickel transport system permease protein